MNYIWEILMEAKKEGIPPEELTFIPAKSASPYMEASMENINRTRIGEDTTIEINPFYRFYPIFKDMLHINQTGYEEARQALFQVMIQYLGENDMRMGLCRTEYYKKFLRRDLEEGIFGKKAARIFLELEQREKDVILENLLCLYQTGTSLYLYRGVVRELFPGSILYHSSEDQRRLYLYLGEKECDRVRNRITLVNDLFLRFDYEIDLFYEHHFGIMGEDATMRLEYMVPV